MNKRDLSPDQVVVDAVLRWTDAITPPPNTATRLAGGMLFVLAVNHRGAKVSAFVPSHLDGEPEDGPPPRFVLRKLGPTVWKVAPSCPFGLVREVWS